MSFKVVFLKDHFDYEEISTTEFIKLKSKLASVFRSLFDNSTAVSVMNEEYRMFYKVGCDSKVTFSAVQEVSSL